MSPFTLRARSVGIPSFFQVPVGEISDVEPGMIVVAGAPIDQGVIMSKPGARLGPRQIREASIFPRAIYEANVDRTAINIDTLEAHRLKTPVNMLDVGDFAIDPSNIVRSSKAIADGVEAIVKLGGMPVVLGGDHCVSLPCVEGFVRGCAELQSSLRIGYLHVDSHPDIRDRYGDIGGTHNQSTQVRRIAENEAVATRNMAWLGLNGSILNPDTYLFTKRNNLKMLSVKMIRHRGIIHAVKEAMAVVADGTDAVYVSVDIDVVNSAEAPGTGSPVFTGLTAAEFLELLEAIGDYDVVRAIDLCEVSPPLDPSGATADLAVSGLLALLKRHLFESVALPNAS